MQERVLLSNLESENDVFDLQWHDEGYWSLSSKSLSIKDKRIYVKQNQLQEVLQSIEYLCSMV